MAKLFIAFGFVVGLMNGDEIDTSNYGNCVFGIQDMYNITGTYDLSRLHLRNNVYEVDDQKNTKYRYKFNICGKIPDNVFNNNDTIPTWCQINNIYPPNICKDMKNGECVEQLNLTEKSYPGMIAILIYSEIPF